MWDMLAWMPFTRAILLLWLVAHRTVAVQLTHREQLPKLDAHEIVEGRVMHGAHTHV